MSLALETETAGLCLVQKLKWEGHGLPGLPGGYAPDKLIDLS